MRMNQIKNTFLLASLLLAGCTADEISGTDNGIVPVPPVELTTPLEIESASLDAEITTRATTTLGSGNSIGVFLSGTGYTDRNNCKYNYSAPNWVPHDNGHTIYLGGAAASVCAYHPWTSGYDNKTAIPLTSQVYASGKDISFAGNRDLNGSSGSKSTSFIMTRAYARLQIKLTKSSDYPGTCAVSKLELQNLIQSASLNITSANGSYSSTNGTTGTTVTTTKNVTPTTTGTVWSDYLLIPCTPYGGAMKIVLTVDGKPMTTTIAGYTPVKGEYKSITLTIKGTGLGITSVTTTDWTTADDAGSFIPVP